MSVSQIYRKPLGTRPFMSPLTADWRAGLPPRGSPHIWPSVWPATWKECYRLSNSEYISNSHQAQNHEANVLCGWYSTCRGEQLYHWW